MKRLLLLILLLNISFFPFCFSKNIKQSLKKDNSKHTYHYQLAAALIFQNEAEHLKEWLEYHKLVGFDHFYLFNNASTDNYMDVISPYIKKGEVEFYDYPQQSNNQEEHKVVQYASYNHALTLAQGKVKWLALIDADEFIVPMKKKTVLEVLNEFEKIGGLYVNWWNFGTSNVDKIPSNKLMIECLTHSASHPTNLGKSIVRPERTLAKCTDAHRMWYRPPYYHVNSNKEKFDWICPVATDKILIFHYYTGDLNHLINIKFPRRQKWLGIELNSYLESMKSLNSLHNPFMLRFVKELRKNMGFNK